MSPSMPNTSPVHPNYGHTPDHIFEELGTEQKISNETTEKKGDVAVWPSFVFVSAKNSYAPIQRVV